MLRVLFSVLALTFALQAHAEFNCETVLTPGTRLSFGNFRLKETSSEFGTVKALLQAREVKFTIQAAYDNVDTQWIALTPQAYDFWARLSFAVLIHIEKGSHQAVPSLHFLDDYLKNEPPFRFMDSNSDKTKQALAQTVQYFTAAQLEGIFLASLSDNLEVSSGTENRRKMSDQMSILLAAGFSRFDALKIVDLLQNLSKNIYDTYSLPTLRSFERGLPN